MKEFVAESEDESKAETVANYSEGVKVKHTWEKFLRNVMQMASAKTDGEDTFQLDRGNIQIPMVNGKHNKSMQQLSLKANGEVLSQGNGVAKMIHANIPVYREVLPGLEGWQSCKIMSWHNLEGNSIQWLSIVCIDRKGKILWLLLLQFEIMNPFFSGVTIYQIKQFFFNSDQVLTCNDTIRHDGGYHISTCSCRNYNIFLCCEFYLMT